MKKSVALLAVLGFILVIITLSVSFLKIYDNYSTNKYIQISQDAMIIKNITSTLNNLLKDINSSNIGEIFTTYPPISSKNGNFIVFITIKPLFNKININNYIENNKTNKYIDNTISTILDNYGVIDPIFFKSLLLDTIDKDLKERDGGSEIKLSDEKFQNGKIYNQNHFNQILNYYSIQRDDKSIYKIPWDKYIFFGDKKQNILDCNLIDKKLAKFIGLNIKDDIISCSSIKIKSNKKIIDNLNMKPFDKNVTYWINVDVNYIKNNNPNNLNLIYDIKTKKVISIEKHFIY